MLDETKHADMNSIYKKESRNVKDNYRTASILPNLSKLFEVVRVINLIFTLVRWSENFNTGFAKGLVHSIVYL